MKIKLHIERLVLEGLPVEQQGPSVAQLRAGLEAELSRLLAAGALGQLRGGAAVPRLPSASITFSPETKPSRLGEQIGQAVHGAIKR